MKIVLAPNAFKGCLSAPQVCDALAEGIRRVLPDADIIKVPVADGGDGTVESLVSATGGQLFTREVTDPLGGRVTARFGVLGDGATAVIEMAEASGLRLVPPEKRNPLITTTFGTGELIRAALEKGCRKLIIGIGGSATNDGGAGMAQALGVRLLDANGNDLPFGGAALARLARIDVSGLAGTHRPYESLTVVVACDVDNPLCGDKGASAIYGPQKGATPEMVRQLDAALCHYAAVLKRDLGKDVANVPGAGAAGGLGAGLMAFLDARLERGVNIVLRAVNMRERVRHAQLVFTGEGAIDGSTVFGKAPVGVAYTAKEFGVPVVAVVGAAGAGYEEVYAHGIDVVVPIPLRPMTLEEAISDAHRLIAAAAERAMRLVRIGHTRGGV
ncbi:MAG: glycerate kinase [Abditibacteriales bacterium]|nr:glycerate kinase [Abditibacteriales bacterium]MDW8367269.1 glycerate kinase [Abditibacteriales bacterium]